MFVKKIYMSKYNINNKSFKTKSEITDYFRVIMYRYDEGIPLSYDDFYDVCELLKYHDEYDIKKGVGIESITIEFHNDLLTNKKAKYPHFQINRLDGTFIDFSFIKCISYINSPKSIENKYIGDIKRTMRFLVKHQIDEFRDECFAVKKYLKCPILEINFSKKTCHIDHTPPKTFDVLVFQFLKENKINFDKIELKEINGIFSTFKDEDLKNKWIEFHENNAYLRPTHQAGNLSQKKTPIDWGLLI